MITSERSHLLLEGARCDAASSRAGLEVHHTGLLEWEARVVAAGDELAITRHTGLATVEEWRALGILGPPRPVVVRLITLVAAFISEHLLKHPSEVTVPGQERALDAIRMTIRKRVCWCTYSSVNHVRLLNVRNHKIVVTALCTSSNTGRGLCGELGKAVDSSGVVELLSPRQG